MSQRYTGRTDRRVVVTGLGVVSPYGRDCQAYWQGLSQGRCMLGPLSLFPTEGFRSDIGGEVNVTITRTLGKAHRSRATRFLVAAAEEAVCHAGLGAAELATAAISIGGAGGGMVGAGGLCWARYGQRPVGRPPGGRFCLRPASRSCALASPLRAGRPR